MTDRATQPAILFEVARRMGHHSKDIGIAVLAKKFARAFVRFRGVAIVDAGHLSP
jgi:hypothetical protein